MRATSAVAALVSPDSASMTLAGSCEVVTSLTLSGPTVTCLVVARSTHAFPPSATTSGLIGQRSGQVKDVREDGAREPMAAIARRSGHVAASTLTRSVHAPTVRVFQAWPGSSIDSISFVAGYPFHCG